VIFVVEKKIYQGAQGTNIAILAVAACLDPAVAQLESVCLKVLFLPGKC